MQGQGGRGLPARTSQGLNCDNDNHISTDDHGKKGFAINSSGDSGSDLELRAGSTPFEHIVGVEAHDGGTRLASWRLTLPGHLSNHDSKSVE